MTTTKQVKKTLTAKILHALSKRYNVKVFNASLGVLGTQEKYDTDIVRL